MINALRTPDERFANLPGFDFAPHYVSNLSGYDGLRMHYLDVGSKSAKQVYLCLHGQPSWSYLYRKMIPGFVSAGGRVIAPDLFGFGRSDKPVDDEIYTWDFHRNALIRFIEYIDPEHVTLVCQDWGGLLGLTLPMEMPERFDRMIVMNTALATGDVPLGDGFTAWRRYNASQPDLDVGGLFARSEPHLTPEELAAYDAPFPDQRFKAGVRRFPELVADQPDSPGADTARQARRYLSEHWDGPTFMAIGMQDPVLGAPAMYALKKLIRGCSDPLEIEAGGHFVQERGEGITEQALAYFDAR